MGKRDQESFDRAVWGAAKEIAHAVADARSADELGKAVIAAIDRMIGFELGTILTAELGQPWSTAGEIGGTCDNRVLEQNYRRYAGELLEEETARKAGRFSAASEALESRRRERLSIFHEFLMPRGLNQAIAGYWVIDGRAWSVGLIRSVVAFSDRAIARLNALLPHLKAALRARSWCAHFEACSNARFPSEYPNGGSPGPWGLTLAQEQTMNLVVRGLTNKEVARLLGTSPNTVRNTLVEVFDKVGVTRRTELAFIARNGSADGYLATPVTPSLIKAPSSRPSRAVLESTAPPDRDVRSGPV
jgi:DNA-binding CsgD family transcriptional regulator